MSMRDSTVGEMLDSARIKMLDLASIPIETLR
jgi:hypothetical protein